jgi:hypothetical protein
MTVYNLLKSGGAILCKESHASHIIGYSSLVNLIISVLLFEVRLEYEVRIWFLPLARHDPFNLKVILDPKLK